MKLIYLGFLLGLCFKCACAQIPKALNVITYDERNGINNGKVTAFLQSKTGYIWLGTTNGLLRFDSYTFKLYDSPAITNTVNHLAEDEHQHIWMSFMGGGLAMFEPQTGKFKRYTVFDKKNTTLNDGEITTMFFDKKGRLWLGVKQCGLVKADCENGVYTEFDFIDKKHNPYTPEIRNAFNTLNGIYEDEQGLFWMATHDGLYQFNTASKRMVAVRKKDFDYKKERTDLFGPILGDDSVLWLGSWTAGLSAYNRKTGVWKNYMPVPEKSGSRSYNYVTNLVYKNKNEFWVGSNDQGLGIFNKITGKFFFFNSSPSYPELNRPNFQNLFCDKDANVWMFQNNGILKISDPDYKFNFIAFRPAKVAPSLEISDWVETENEQFIATSNAYGLQVINKKTGITQTFAVETEKNEDPSMEIRQLYLDSKKRLWVLSRDYIYRYDNTLQKLERLPDPEAYSPEKKSNNFNGITEDKLGNFWIVARRNGVFVYNDSTRTYTHYSDKNYAHYINASQLLTTATDIKGRVWIGGYYSYLGYADPLDKKITQLLTGFGDKLKLLGTQTLSLFADNSGNIWAGTFFGLYYFNCQGKLPVLKKILRARDGLRSDVVTNIQQDAYGNMWCITDAGVCMVDKRNYNIYAFDRKDGIDHGSNLIRIVNSPDKTMKLLTDHGYYTFNPLMINKDVQTAPVQLVQMMVNKSEYYFDSSQKIQLRPDQNSISFEFAAINFSGTENQQFEYMLEGIDKKWMTSGASRIANYNNIHGGDYKFKIRKINNNAITEYGGISIPIFIGTPFYNTYIFYIAILLSIAAMVYRLYLNRLTHHREVLELKSKAQMLEKEKVLVMYEGLKQQLNPHFLFNSLSSLSGLIQTDKKMAGIFLDQMSKIYRYILQNRDSDTVPLSEELKFVSNYVKLQKTRFCTGLVVNFDIDEDYSQRKIAPVTLQNLVENCIKHNIIDSESPLVIDLFCEDEYLIVQNNLQRKAFVETSNKQGLIQLQILYSYLTSELIIITETKDKFIVMIPLL